MVNKKHLLSLVLILGLLAMAVSAWANPSGWGRGYGPGCPGGYCWGPGGDGPAVDKETAGLWEDLYQKNLEMRALLSAEKVDEEKVKALQDEITKLRDQVYQKRIEAQLEFRKRNPDWRPGYGWGRGGGRGWGRGCCRY